MTEQTTPARPIDWVQLREAAETLAHPATATDAAAEDVFRRLATPATVLALLEALSVVVAFDSAVATMTTAAEEIRSLLGDTNHAKHITPTTLTSLAPWIRHVAPCIVGTRADDGDVPEKCICGLTERLAEVVH